MVRTLDFVFRPERNSLSPSLAGVTDRAHHPHAARRFLTASPGFVVLEDARLASGHRWLRVASAGRA